MVARQLDELNPPLAVVNFQGGHARTVSSGWEKGKKSADGATDYRPESRSTSGLESPQRLLGDDLESVAAVLGYHPEPGDPDLAGLAAPIAHFELGELLLDAPGVELKHHLAERDPRLANQGHIRGLAASALPEEIEATVTPARSVPLGRLVAGQIRQVSELIGTRDDSQLNTQGIELAGLFRGGLVGRINDAPALFAGDAAVAGPESQVRPADTQLGCPLAAGDRAPAGHHRAQVNLGQTRSGLGRRIDHRPRRRLDRRLLEVARFFLVVGSQRAGVSPRHVDLLG